MRRRSQFRLLIFLTLAWAAWAAWSLVGGSEPFTLRVVDDAGRPVPEAVVAAGGHQLGLTAADGTVVIEGVSQPIEISAPGHVGAIVASPEPTDGVLDTVLKARVLRGEVVDASGRAVSDAVVSAGLASATTDGDGAFELRGAEPGLVTVKRPAWEKVSFDWAGGPGDQQIVMDPAVAKAVHISGEAVEKRFDQFLAMATDTELNALMVDLKDETGQVLYESQVPLAKQVGADAGMYDLRHVASLAHGEGLYLIGRLVAFQDPIAAKRMPEMSVWDSATQAPFTSRGQYFLDPTDPDARAYALDLAKEACSMGVDELQFDYVRFPDSRPESAMFDGGVTAEVRAETMRGFLSDAVAALHPLGCAVAADVFGFVTTVEDDGGIGQNWLDVTSVVDVASPMLYPSHYNSGWFGFDSPNSHPGPVVQQALSDGLDRLSRQVVVRPWLQDFNYDASQVRAQIDIAESYGLGWMLWNATSNVTTNALEGTSP